MDAQPHVSCGYNYSTNTTPVSKHATSLHYTARLTGQSECVLSGAVHWEESVRSMCHFFTSGRHQDPYIYIYAFIWHFYPKWLTVHSGCTFLSVCVPWELNPQPLTQCSTTEPQEHYNRTTTTSSPGMHTEDNLVFSLIFIKCTIILAHSKINIPSKDAWLLLHTNGILKNDRCHDLIALGKIWHGDCLLINQLMHIRNGSTLCNLTGTHSENLSETF